MLRKVRLRRLLGRQYRLAFVFALAAPGDAQRVQDELVVQVEPGRIAHQLPCVEDFRIAGNAPSFVTDQAVAEIAHGIGGVSVAMKPGVGMP